MATRKPSRRALLRDRLATLGGPIVDEPIAAAIAADAGVSRSYLRKVLIEGGFPMAPLVEGVRQDSFPALERTLLALLDEYVPADPERRRQCRRCVITAKDHARLALRQDTPEAARDRHEMILWMVTWLENPGIFRQWLALRKRAHPSSP